MTAETMLAARILVLTVMLLSFMKLMKAIKTQERRGILMFKTLCSLMFWCFGLTFILHGSDGLTPVSSFMMAGYSCSIAGDVFLVYKSKRCFMAGLVSFFLAHACYSFVFIARSGFSMGHLILFFMVSALPLYFINTPKYFQLGRMKVPGHAYLLILCFMLSNALSAVVFKTASPWGSLAALTGALLFFASDMLLACRHFGTHRKRSYHGIGLAAYYLAQLLLGLGMLS